MFYKLGPWSTILTDNFWWSFLLRKKIVIITIIIVIIIIIIIIIITISLLSSSSSLLLLSLLSSLLLGYWQKNAGILWEEEIMQNTHYGKSTSLNAEFYTSASVFAKYTERQKKLITSLERHSLKSKALKLIKIGHRLAIVLLTKHISKSKCLESQKRVK